MAVCLKYGKMTLPNVPHKEPVFIFRAQDIFAEKYIKMYAEVSPKDWRYLWVQENSPQRTKLSTMGNKENTRLER